MQFTAFSIRVCKCISILIFGVVSLATPNGCTYDYLSAVWKTS